MSQIFLKILNMSISASYVVLAVLLLRILIKKAPKWITVVMWGAVALRLVFPFSIESVLSLIPSPETVSPGIMTDSAPSIDSGIPIINNAINPIINQTFAPIPGDSANPLQVIVPILTIVWVVGMVALLVYMVISYLRLERNIGTAVLYKNTDNVYQSENVGSPFVLGVFRPRIYLPFNMDEGDMDHVIAHECAHISRRDHLWKPLGFLLLAVYWFNPLMWLSYVLLCRDIELACDEKVVKELDIQARAEYSQALLTCSIKRSAIAACPLAFGEVGVKDRVKSVINYRKPGFWIVVTAVVACVVVVVCFLTNPVKDSNDVIANAPTPTPTLQVTPTPTPEASPTVPPQNGQSIVVGDQFSIINYDGDISALPKSIVIAPMKDQYKDITDRETAHTEVSLPDCRDMVEKLLATDYGMDSVAGMMLYESYVAAQRVDPDTGVDEDSTIIMSRTYTYYDTIGGIRVADSYVRVSVDAEGVKGVQYNRMIVPSSLDELGPDNLVGDDYITPFEAYAEVLVRSPTITIASVALSYVPVEGVHVLCYEFITTWAGSIYVDVISGEKVS